MKKENLLKLTNKENFQTVFGSKGSEPILTELLESILEQKLTNVKISEKPVPKEEYLNDDSTIIDLTAVINDNEEINITIQFENKDVTNGELIYYWTRVYSNQPIDDIKKTISITMVNYEITELADIKDGHIIWKIRDEDNNEVEIFRDFEIHLIELPKMLKNGKNLT